MLETHAVLEPHVDAIELNASCPNVAWGRDRDNEAHLVKLLREARESPGLVAAKGARAAADVRAKLSPERVIGMHFFNPVPVLALVEVIRAEQTSNETAEAIVALARDLGQVGDLLAKDAAATDLQIYPSVDAAIAAL